MSVDAKTIENICSLCRLEIGSGLPQDDKKKAQADFCQEINKLIAYTANITGADTEAVEPLYAIFNQGPGPRPDEPKEECLAEDILQQAPGRTANFFAVPKIL